MQREIRLTDDVIERNSPQFHIRQVPAPLLVTYGGDETAEFCRQSDDFLAAWTAAGNRGIARAQPGANHFTAITGLASPESALCRGIFEFMGHRPDRTSAASAAAAAPVGLRGRPGDIPRFERRPSGLWPQR
jgi:arylformamidase